MKKVIIDGIEKSIDESGTLYDLAYEAEGYDAPVALAIENGKLRELFHTPEDGAEIRFVTIKETPGYDALRRSLSMLFFAAVDHCFGVAGRTILHFGEGSGFYFTIGGEIPVDDAFITRIKECMLEMVHAGERFRKRSIPLAEAGKLFRDLGMPNREKLFRTRLSSKVNIYSLREYQDYYYGFMLYDTSLLGRFEIIPYQSGLVLQMPDRENPEMIPEFNPSDKLFRAQMEGEIWAEKIGTGTVGDLNEKTIAGEAFRTILISEALQEAKISDIAETVSSRHGVRFVMIAGPSSSGKTTFSQRLCIQLSAHGMNPHYIGTDNYFVNREDMIPGPDGKLDFEGLSAVDVEQFNDDMEQLLQGKTVEIPTFDFISGKRVMNGDLITMGENDILVIEGLHCLNDELSYRLPKESKFKVYISALTQLNVDEHNRVPTGDGRLVRRIVRDYRTRGCSAAQTIDRWSSVRRGEAENIFPYQESADVIYNSAFPYELAVLKTYALPLLFQVKPDDPSYFEARRLLKFLEYFVAIPEVQVPTNSILREFVGGGCFRL